MDFTKRHENENSAGYVKRFLISCLVSILLIPLLSLIFAILCYNSENPLSGVGLYSLLSLLLSAVAGGFISSIICRRSAKLSMLSGITVSLITLGTNLIFCEGLVLPAFMNCGCYILVYSFFAFLAMGRRKEKRGRRARR